MPGHQVGRNVYQIGDVQLAIKRVRGNMQRFRAAGHNLTPQLQVLVGLEQHLESTAIRCPKTNRIVQYQHLNAFELEKHEADVLAWALGPDLG